MLKKVEEWLLTKFLGKVVARLAVTVASYVASAQVQAILAQAGVHGVAVDPAELTAAMIAIGHAAFEFFKKTRIQPEAGK